jgi:hypothetical protein
VDGTVGRYPVTLQLYAPQRKCAMNGVNDISVRLHKVQFFSYGDENAMFAWIKTIKSVTSVTGAGQYIVLNVSLHRINDKDLQELIGLLNRYRKPLSLLRPLLKHKDFGNWLRNKEAFWFKRLGAFAK